MKAITVSDRAAGQRAANTILLTGHCLCNCRQGTLVVMDQGMEIACDEGTAILFQNGKELFFKAGEPPFLLHLWPVPTCFGCFEASGHPTVFNRPVLLPEPDVPGSTVEPVPSSNFADALRFCYTLFTVWAAQHRLAAVPPTGKGRKAVVASDFIRMVREDRRVQRVSHYAGRLCVTEGYIAKCLKSAGLPPPKKCIMAAICEKAKPLLSDGRHNIMEVAELLGFETVSGFSDFFKSCNGLSPAAYRRIYNLQ